MIEVEDKDPTNRADIQVGTVERPSNNIMVSQKEVQSGIVFHKDTWPALKAAVDKTIQLMEAKPLLREADVFAARGIIGKVIGSGGVYRPELVGRILRALERGYV